ncbi:oligopeptide transport system substrate-binding protein [Enterococcus sp. PF1-24]|uniref:peptide ABC transporter substrate-binding protein n=1 Tax=unclassified Enterococcus TaxID=2608891 RepID=UPI0024763768|nr:MULTISPECIES: peptide ABC transporter substrate-binding protein [unclassified Enterococcus]MDH6365244.1 oligopeptide transport system substrate-binding protein [Enterococcus sp. PFB1-1]MDH6402345.1 oligopeptide transport system substrate-binding protein [Enterococcus sp. PF1-24]
MKKIIKKLAVASIALSCFAGCGSDQQANEKTKDTTAEKSKTVQLMSLSELTTLDTAGMLDFPDAITHTAAFEGLYTLDENDELIPAAAKDLPEISEDGLIYTIKLRENMQWSNGDTVTAKDFEYAWKRVTDPENAYVYSFLVQENIKNGVEVAAGEKPVSELGVKALDDYTLEVELTEAKPYFTSLMAFSTFLPQNEKAVEEFGEKYGTTSETVVYNGPFIVENWSQSEITWDLKKNPDYWDADNVKVDAVHYETIKEGSTALNLYEDDSLDLAYLSGTLAEMNMNHADFKSYPTATMNYIRFNQKRAGADTPLANENLRKALALGIDKETLIRNVVADGSVPLYGAITEGFVKNPVTEEDFRSEAGDLAVFNETEALKYWEAAKKELGEKIEIELMTTDADQYKKLGESIQGEWQNRFDGLTVTIRSLPTQTALNISAESDYDAFLIYWTPDYQDPISTLKMLYSGNNRNYNNPAYDALLDQAAKDYALEPEKRWQALLDAEKVGIEDTAGMLILSQNQQTVLQNPELKGVNFHTFGAPLTLKNLEWQE